MKNIKAEEENNKCIECKKKMIPLRKLDESTGKFKYTSVCANDKCDLYTNILRFEFYKRY